MMEIIKLQEHKKTVTLTFSDGSLLKLPLLAKIDFLLYEGKEVDSALFYELEKYGRQQKDYQYALTIVSRFSYTTFEIRTKLRNRNVSEKDIDEIVTKLEQLNYVNDYHYAEERIRYLIITKKESKRSVIQKLRQKGLSDEVINKYLNEYINEEEVIEKLALKTVPKHARHSLRYAQDKVIAFLLRRGFKYEDVRNAIKNIPFSQYINEGENIKKDRQSLLKKKVDPKLATNEKKKILYNELMKLKYNSFLINNVLEELDDEN